MDPNATYREFLDCLASGDISGAAEHAGNLSTWCGKGGFVPENCRGKNFSPATFAKLFDTVETVLLWADHDANGESD